MYTGPINFNTLHHKHCTMYLYYVHYSLLYTEVSTPYANCTSGDVRLVPGTTNLTQSEHSMQGRLEVCINSAWGSVCLDPFFDTDDAGVACSQLGGFYFEGRHDKYLCL